MEMMEEWGGGFCCLGEQQILLVSQAVKYAQFLNCILLYRKSEGHFQQHFKTYNLVPRNMQEK